MAYILRNRAVFVSRSGDAQSWAYSVVLRDSSQQSNLILRRIL
jgi:hypothetical protein